MDNILPKTATGNMDASNMRTLVGMALGRASVCWDNVEKAGVFDSDTAVHLTDELMAAIEQHVDYEKARHNRNQEEKRKFIERDYADGHTYDRT